MLYFVVPDPDVNRLASTFHDLTEAGDIRLINILTGVALIGMGLWGFALFSSVVRFAHVFPQPCAIFES